MISKGISHLIYAYIVSYVRVLCVSTGKYVNYPASAGVASIGKL